MSRFTVECQDPERAAMWRRVQGTEGVPEAPVLSPAAEFAALPGHPDGAWVLMADLGALSPDQRERLITELARKFGLSRADVASDLGAVGVPILLEGCVLREDGQPREPETPVVGIFDARLLMPDIEDVDYEELPR